MRKFQSVVFTALLIGAASAQTGCLSGEDYDQDGYGVGQGDCDDANPEVNPGAQEVCNGIDDNCDGVADGSDAEGAESFYVDADGDGFGDEAAVVILCEPGDGHVIVAGDCDDGQAEIYPGADEFCDTEWDNDCDGQIDEGGAVDATVYYADADGDGHGDPEAPVSACVIEAGLVESATDCDDTQSTVHPDAEELCASEADDDCDGLVDEETASDAMLWYADEDGDGFGDEGTALTACVAPSEFHVSNGEDCDDGDVESHPQAEESCTQAGDNDCDGQVDEDGAYDAPLWYADEDGDGFGDADNAVAACVPPSESHVSNAEDCDDRSDATHPGAEETCASTADDDCDGLVDEASAPDVIPFYFDEDGDGYGDAGSEVLACAAPSEFYVDNGEDCDDAQVDTNPGADELCALEGDNDCDGQVDEAEASDVGIWYPDVDIDGFGDDLAPLYACEQPEGHLADGGDCDDEDAEINPFGIEVCEGQVDEDCDGDVDESEAEGGILWYRDSDGDGFGDEDGEPVEACAAPSEAYVEDATDCNDNKAEINPGTVEICDGKKDEDCDGLVDEEAGTEHLDWYVDEDGDGFGVGEIIATACTGPEGAASTDGDCDDSVAGVHPDARETCDGDTDEDCDGQVDESDSTNRLTFYADGDADGYGDQNATTLACDAPEGYVENDDDCDDDNGEINPGMDELCDGFTDEDCDKTIDETAEGQEVAWFLDEDGDGYGIDETEINECNPPSDAYVTLGGDCEDDNPDINPGTEEFCDGIDTNCDGDVDFGFTIPHDFDTIDAAIDSAGGGAHLCVAPGTYYENLVVGVPLTIESMDGPESTIIDGGLEDRVIRFTGNGSSALIGLTLQNGYNTGGAGIHTGANVNLHIEDSVIQHNFAESETAQCQGVGIRITGDATMDRVIVRYNTANCNSVSGAGILLKGEYAELNHVAVVANTAEIKDQGDGALNVYYSSVDAQNLIVAGNGIYASDGHGDIRSAGILTHGVGDNTFVNLDIVGNEADAGSGDVYGAGFMVDADNAASVSNLIVNANVSGNQASGGSVESGGYYAENNPDMTLYFSNAHGNAISDYGNLLDPVGVDGNLSVAPNHVDTSGDDAALWDLSLAEGSALIDAGDDERLDADGSVSDIGAYGGPFGDDWLVLY